MPDDKFYGHIVKYCPVHRKWMRWGKTHLQVLDRCPIMLDAKKQVKCNTLLEYGVLKINVPKKEVEKAEVK